MRRRPRLYNKKTGDAPADAVYIGRPSKWGNAYSHLPGTLARFQVASRDEAIAAFERDLLANPRWVAKVKAELRGKDLVCWCYPLRCHGEILLRLANGDDRMKPKTGAIDRFDGEFGFLSNFFILPQPIVYEGFTSWSTEAAFQAAKALDPTERARIAAMDPGPSKRAGRSVEKRPDWEDGVRDAVMLDVTRLKYAIPALGRKLLATEDRPLIEGNHWHDSYWGHCTCGRCPVGKNRLGRTLVRVRRDLGEGRTSTCNACHPHPWHGDATCVYCVCDKAASSSPPKPADDDNLDWLFD